MISRHCSNAVSPSSMGRTVIWLYGKNGYLTIIRLRVASSGPLKMPKPPPPPAKNSKDSMCSLLASRQAAKPYSRVGNISGGVKNFGSTRTNARMTLSMPPYLVAFSRRHDATSRNLTRTSENSVITKFNFAEFPFHALVSIGGVTAYDVAHPLSSVHNGAPRRRRCRCDLSNG